MNNSKEICRFCGKELVQLKEYYICESCETVAITRTYEPDEIKSKILEHLETVQQSISAEREELYRILQDDINRTPLSLADQAKKEYCEKFQDLRVFLLTFLGTDASLNDISVRKHLYQLLKLDEGDVEGQ